MLEDKLLIRKFNRGDNDALRRIYEKYRNDLLKVAAALLNDRNGVEDVLHDVFVSFAQAVGNFQLRGSLKGYLSICIANRARDKNRSAQRKRTVGLDNAGPLRSDSSGPVHLAVRGELSKRLGSAMAQLPYEQREIIILHLQSRMRFRQIAKSKGVSANTIRSRYRYGLNKLRSILDGQLIK
ncbi:MAG: RNA polymerase sigma factor [Planctomycetota bacterium]|jgi:RNA polymerase sigma-70 factor (ECF subfamily)